MLKIPVLPADEKAAEIVKIFINNRLIELKEGVIMDEVGFQLAMDGELDESTAEKTFDELVNIDSLMEDIGFAEEVSMRYLPDNFPIERANREFFSLYRLLKAKNEHVPELPMEYILFHIIEEEVWKIDLINGDAEDGVFDELVDDLFFEGIEDGEYSTIMLIPEPDRSVVMEAMEAEAEELYEDEDSLTVDELINRFEDLREYEETCFWDFDFEMLDEIDEKTLISSDMAKYVGIGERRDKKIIQFPTSDGGKSVNIEMNIAPWDMEDEDYT